MRFFIVTLRLCCLVHMPLLTDYQGGDMMKLTLTREVGTGLPINASSFKVGSSIDRHSSFKVG